MFVNYVSDANEFNLPFRVALMIFRFKMHSLEQCLKQDLLKMPFVSFSETIQHSVAKLKIRAYL